MAISTTDVRTLKRLARHGAQSRVVRLAEKRSPADLAAALVAMSRPEARRLARALVLAGNAGATFSELAAGKAEEILSAVSDEDMGRVVSTQVDSPTSGAALLCRLPADRRTEILRRLPETARRPLELALVFRAGPVGAVRRLVWNLASLLAALGVTFRLRRSSRLGS